MLSTREILLEYVSPLLGAIFANLMFAAPLKDVHRAVQNGSLGHLNPTPWAVMTGNTLGWITYSYLLNNYFIFFANAPGFIFSIWLNMAAAKLQYCDRLADNMRSSFAEMVEVKRQSMHKSMHQSMMRERSQRRNPSAVSFQIEHNAESKCDRPIDEERLRAHDILDNSWKQRAEDTDLESTLKQTNRVNLDPAPSYSISTTQNHNSLDESTNSGQFIHPHHMLQKFAELGTAALGISTERMEAPAPHEKVVVSIIVAWFVFISCIIFIPMDDKRREFIIGIAVNVNMSFFYGAPLSIIWKVIKTKDSGWIHHQTMIMNTLCALFFLAFGFGRMDYFLIVPNGIGVVLGGVQLFLRLIVPHSESLDNSNPERKAEINLNTVKRPKLREVEDSSISLTSELSA
ncbi:hypothetical protein ACHAWO_008278 [Cyclotella atomus]|uniref:MtN3-like protein n=1 Tax=Cyclotella atomus TaxID=382360 RepID=A0ABD3MW10_9STRA